MKKKTVCILSMQRVNNFGSLLQSYSLKKIIEDFDYDVSFIDIKNGYIINKNNTKLYQLIKKIVTKLNKYIFNYIHFKPIVNKQNVLFEEFRKNNLAIKDEDNNRKYDTCVIGSDEVFNCLTESPWGISSQLFGNVEQAQKIITYATSCGQTTYDKLSKQAKDIIQQGLVNIVDFSVRDENTNTFIKFFIDDKPVYTHLDPVVIGDFSKEISKVNKVKLPKKYCIVYSYYNRFKDKKEIKCIKQFCKKHGLEIIAIGAPQLWIRNFIALDPFEVLYAFLKADFVITDTFHGTIFAAKYSHSFATIIRESNKNKLTDLLHRINKTEHLLDNISELEEIYNKKNDIDEMEKLSRTEYNNSLEYLKKSL